MTREDEIEKLQLELIQNPKSPQFARLAELYLSRELIEEASQLITKSLKFHPRSVSGLILYGRVLKKQKKINESIVPLQEATKLAPENWRAWLELGEVFLELKNGKKALHAFKKVLFLNPTNGFARKAVHKLEILTADEYEEELFTMQSLPETELGSDISTGSESSAWKPAPENLNRIISYIDALIVRQENQKAIDLLNDCSKKYGSHPEIETRRLQLSSFEKSEYIKPKSSAQKSKSYQVFTVEKKVKILQQLLHRIEHLKSQNLST